MADIDLVTADRVNLVEDFGRQKSLVAASAITAGAPVYITSAGKFAHADGNGSGTTQPWGVALRTVAAGVAVTAVRVGVMDGWDLTALAFGDPVYMSDTVGRLGTTAGSTSVVIGRVVPATAVSLGTTPDKLIEVDVP